MPPTNKIVHLQSLRAVAATLVVASHALEYSVRRHIIDEDGYTLAWTLGWLGVATFFVISGFIMIRSSWNDFGSRAGALDFLRRRFLRVAPLYWLVMIPAGVATLLRGGGVDLGTVSASALFIPYYSHSVGAMRPLVGQGWTLNYEMMFYALFAAALLFSRRMGVVALVGCLVVLVMLRTEFWPLVPYEDPKTLLQFWTDPLVLLFAVGVVIGWVEQTRGAHWHTWPLPVLTTLALFAAATFAFVCFGGGFPMPIAWQAALAAAGTIGVVLCTSGRAHASQGVGRLLERAGDASYSTYLVHPFVLMALSIVAIRLPILLQPVVIVPLAIVLCNLAGYLTFRVVERPLVRALNRRMAGSSGQPRRGSKGRLTLAERT